MAIGKRNKVSQPVPDKPSMAIRPMRAECAADIISSRTGAAQIKPMPAAIRLILPTMICIWRAINPSDAPIWFKISSSRRCNIAVFRAIYDIQMPIVPSVSASISDAIIIICQPALVDDFSADAWVKKRAFFDIWSPTVSRSDLVLKRISHIFGR